MRFSEILNLVKLNLIQNKFKVLLTSIGIIVGAATIVSVIAIGKGGKADVADRIGSVDVCIPYRTVEFAMLFLNLQ